MSETAQRRKTSYHYDVFQEVFVTYLRISHISNLECLRETLANDKRIFKSLIFYNNTGELGVKEQTE